jgi:hypothetical protein
MWRRGIWVLVGLAAAYVLMLMLTTPTPSKNETGNCRACCQVGCFERVSAPEPATASNHPANPTI